MFNGNNTEARITSEQLLKDTPEEIKKILVELLRIERRYIHMERRPNGIFDELKRVIEQEIK